MKRSVLAVSIAFLLQAMPAAAQNEPRVLAPASQWVLDFADERCSLIRQFGPAGDGIRLQIDAFGPGLKYRAMLSGEALPVSSANRVESLRLVYSPDTGERERFFATTGTFEGHEAVSFRQAFQPLPGGDAGEFERSIDWVTLDFRNQSPVRLDTGSMAAAFEVMHQCIDDLVASWGLDPAGQRALSRPVQVAELAEGREFLRPQQGDYPSYAERRRRAVADAVLQSGTLFPVRLMIDATGEPGECVVQVDHASEAKRAAICTTLAGDTYRPALDAEGRPVASFIQVETN